MNHRFSCKANQGIIGKGYTMIEILVAISIIGFIAAAAMYAVNSSREKGRIAGLLQFSGGIKASLSESPIAYWSFDDSGLTARDSFGQNHGTITGATLVAGVKGNARSFNGSSQYVTIPAPGGSPLDIDSGGKITLEAWINANAFPVGDYMQIVGRGVSVSNGYSLNTNENFLNIGLHGCANNTGIIPLAAGKWQHVVGVYDGANKTRIYVNGRLDSNFTNVNICNSDEDVFIGYYPSFGRYFNGLIDEVRIYGEALSFSQIRQHYVEGAAKRGLAIK